MILFFILIVVAVMTIAIVKSSKNDAPVQTTKTQDEIIDSLHAEVERMKLMTEVMIQSKAVGDETTYNLVIDGKYKGPWPEERSDGGYLSLYDDLRILKIAGINYRHGINRYTGRVMCALVPEPNNEYDPNAIKIVAEDRHHLGYIPTDDTDMVRSMTDGAFPYRCEAHIYEAEDEEDEHKFFYGFVYIKRAAVAQQHTRRDEKDKGQR